MTIDNLVVHTPQGHSGRLFIGADNHYVLRYDPEVNPGCAISLLMPVRTEEYRRRELHPIFQMNLPEGFVLEQLRNRLAKTVNVDPMLMLALSGSYSPIGRVFVSTPKINELIQKHDSQASGERLDEILAWDGK